MWYEWMGLDLVQPLECRWAGAQNSVSKTLKMKLPPDCNSYIPLEMLHRHCQNLHVNLCAGEFHSQPHQFQRPGKLDTGLNDLG